MADKKPSDQKDTLKAAIDAVDSTITGYVLRLARASLRKLFLDPLKKWNPSLWYGMAYVYLKADSTFREAFEGALRAAAILGDVIIEALPVPHLFKKVAEDILADGPNEIANYYREMEKTIEFPEELAKKEWTVDEIKQLGTNAGAFLRRQIEERFNWVAKQVPLLMKLKGRTHAKHVRALFGLGSRYVRRYTKFVAATIRTDEDWSLFKSTLEYMDEPEELQAFLDLSLAEQQAAYGALKKIKRSELWFGLVQFAKKHGPAALVKYHGGVRGLTHAVELSNAEVALRNQTRQARNDEYTSEQNLALHPHRRISLPNGDNRKALPFRVPRWIAISLLGITGMVVAAVGYSLVGMATNRPVVTIIRPVNNALVQGESAELEAHIESQRYVTSLRLTTPDGQVIDLHPRSAKVMTILRNLSLNEGNNTFLLEAIDESKRADRQSFSVFRPRTVTPDQSGETPSPNTDTLTVEEN